MQTTTRHDGPMAITTHDYSDELSVPIITHHAHIEGYDHLSRTVTITYRPDATTVTIVGPTVPDAYDEDDQSTEYTYRSTADADALVTRLLTEQDMRHAFERSAQAARARRMRH